VPLGKLGTERTVPLDATTLSALDEWMTLRGPQRALPHLRLNRLADFPFVERGQRLSNYWLRHGLDDAATAAGLRGHDGQPLHVTPHQLRHTYATSLVKRRHVAAGADGAARPRHHRDDSALRLARRAHYPDR
jgi:integrase